MLPGAQCRGARRTVAPFWAQIGAQFTKCNQFWSVKSWPCATSLNKWRTVRLISCTHTAQLAQSAARMRRANQFPSSFSSISKILNLNTEPKFEHLDSVRQKFSPIFSNLPALESEESKCLQKPQNNHLNRPTKWLYLSIGRSAFCRRPIRHYCLFLSVSSSWFLSFSSTKQKWEWPTTCEHRPTSRNSFAQQKQSI